MWGWGRPAQEGLPAPRGPPTNYASTAKSPLKQGVRPAENKSVIAGDRLSDRSSAYNPQSHSRPPSPRSARAGRRSQPDPSDDHRAAGPREPARQPALRRRRIARQHRHRRTFGSLAEHREPAQPDPRPALVEDTDQRATLTGAGASVNVARVHSKRVRLKPRVVRRSSPGWAETVPPYPP